MFMTIKRIGRRHRICLRLALAAFVGALVWFGCDSSAGPGTRGGLAAPVDVAPATTMDAPRTVSAVGVVEPVESVAVRSQVTGYVRAIHFREGDDVRAGQVLFQLDQRALGAVERQTAASLSQARVQAQTAADQRRRAEALYRQKFISQEEWDRIRSAAESLEATVAAQEAALDKARLDRQYTTIVAPLAGRAGRRLVNEGDLVKANDVTMVTINRIRPIDVQFSLPEKELSAVQAAQKAGPVPVTAKLAGDKTEPLAGQLVFVDNAVDPQTGSILLKARFDNGDERLWPGRFVEVGVTLEVRRNVAVVPAAAVQIGQQGSYVFVVGDDQKAQLRQVTAGAPAGEFAVIESGLQAGERVVINGQMRLSPGAPVEIREKPGAAPTASAPTAGTPEPAK